MQAQHKNMERMEEVVVEAEEQNLQYMLTESSWKPRDVLDQVAREADGHLGGTPDSCLLIDESACAKKGQHSVGVARQWCGRLGKVENCQVGVFAVLGKAHRATVIDARLYLPQEWIASPTRCQRAGIPKSAHVQRSKVELALEMVRHQRASGGRFAWVGADGGYGKEPSFTRALEEMGEVFVVDVHRDQTIYLIDPEPRVPEKLSGRGRAPVGRKAQTPGVRVEPWVAEQPPQAWSQVTLRDSTKGALSVEILHRRIWVWDGREAQAHHWHLIVRRELHSPETIKYTLSNADEHIPPHRLARMQAQRFWVERAFQDAKSEAGLADYQARQWSSWHHHMALVSMAMLFMLEERILQKDAHPLLSCSDVESLLRAFLPRRDIDHEEVLRQMEKRHQRRQAAIDSHHRKCSVFSVG